VARRRQFVLSRAEERRRNAKAAGIALVIFGLIAWLAFRPATVTGVDAKPLANSVGNSLVGTSACVDTANGWRCSVGGKNGVVYAVETQPFGCWDAVVASGHAGRDFPTQKSGCINGLDLIEDGSSSSID
jgi:hypothetical protein